MWLAGLVAAGLTLAPAAARAQDGGPDGVSRLNGGLPPDLFTVRAQTPDGALPDTGPCPEVPLPLGHNPNNNWGFYAATEFVFFRQTNPLEHQLIAVRGFRDADGSITGTPGTFIGSGTPVLDAKDAGGPGTYQPGLRVTLGYAFKDGSSIEVEWMNLLKAQYFHEATIVPVNFNFGPLLADSFLFAPVFNFTNAFAGPQGKIDPAAFPGASPTATYGIWDGADVMTIRFVQRTESVQVKYKVPILYNDDCGYRCYGTVGPRFFWIWEQFYWRTVNQLPSGEADPTMVGIYTNTVSNRMYGAFIGTGNEWYIGHGFACNLDFDVAGLLDIVKERAEYHVGDEALPGGIKRARTVYAPVPEVSARFDLTWFPYENIEFKLGYELMVFANTIAATQPVSFNVGALDPPWVHRWRVLDGLHFGVGLMF
jgi:hypothetical protein